MGNSGTAVTLIDEVGVSGKIGTTDEDVGKCGKTEKEVVVRDKKPSFCKDECSILPFAPTPSNRESIADQCQCYREGSNKCYLTPDKSRQSEDSDLISRIIKTQATLVIVVVVITGEVDETEAKRVFDGKVPGKFVV